MAPILSLLRHMSETGTQRPVRFYYGARTAADLFYLDEIDARRGADRLRVRPRLSEYGDGWDGETGMVTDVVARLEADIAEVSVPVRATADGRRRAGLPRGQGLPRVPSLRQVHQPAD